MGNGAHGTKDPKQTETKLFSADSGFGGCHCGSAGPFDSY
jgi:hypothetical protein